MPGVVDELVSAWLAADTRRRTAGVRREVNGTMGWQSNDCHQNRQGAESKFRGAGEKSRGCLAVQLLHALGGSDDVGEADSEFVVNHHHLALGDQRTVNQNIHGLAGEAVEFHHRAVGQLQ